MSAEKNITRKDVAEKAGVSVSVVSRVLNNSGYVDKEKKKKIIKIAEQLGYIPNPIAMALQTRRTYQIIFFCNDLTGAYYNQMYHGMAKTAKERGYHLLLQKDYDFESVKKILADGIIFPTENVAQDYAETVGKNYRLPTVTISFDPSAIFAKPMPSVVIENQKIINASIDYLIQKGHKKIGMLLPFDYGYANSRYKAWKERMKMESIFLGGGVETNYEHYIINCGKPEEENKKKDYRYLGPYQSESEGFVYYDLFKVGYEAANLYKSSKYKATALICFNDDLAQGFIAGLQAIGLRVPEDISVMGIDGIFTRNHFKPKLTTMSIYPERQGAKCVEVLIDMLERKKYKYMNYSPYGILEGETVKDLK